MERERATKILERMLNTLCSGGFIARPRQFFIFGSYARGAVKPNDLDLLLLYEVPEDHDARNKEYQAQGLPLHMFWQKSPKIQYVRDFSKKLRRPGEKVDLLIHETLEYESLLDGIETLRDEHRLLWDVNDQAWKEKLALLQPNPGAGRFPRKEFFPLDLF